MNFAEALRMALTSLRTNKMRSALTLLGVIIGIAAVISILTLGKALQSQFAADLDKVGANNFQVQVVPRAATAEEEEALRYAPEQHVDPDAYITEDMLDKLREQMGAELEGVIIGEYSQFTAQVTAEGARDEKTVYLQPTNPDFVAGSKYAIVAGRSLSAEDVSAARAVAVLPAEAAGELFGGAEAALGRTISAEADGALLELAVIGVYEEPDTGPLVGTGRAARALIPYPLEAMLSDAPGAGTAFSSLTVRAAAPDAAAKQAVGRKLQQSFDALYASNPDYRVKVTDFSEDLAGLNKMMTMLSVAIAAIGGISLLVGGIGVMNIMLITVTERTREIGVRKALGARRRDIRQQFVVEAIIVCLIGGLLGVALGAVAGMVGAQLMGSFVFPPPAAIVVSLLFSLLIGLFFGYYPANKAAKLDAIEALRYE